MSQTDYRRQPALQRVHGRVVSIGRIDETDVLDAYRRWAPVYDYTFGLVAGESRRHAVQVLNKTRGRVLEVGVGTGLSLPDYKRHLEVTGIDLSPEMLEKARERVAQERLDHVTGLHEMDASDLKFPDASFDTVVAMFVMTVVPDPEKVMRELARVVKPGGEVMLVNHFSQRQGVRGWVERRMAPFADKIGWRSVFDLSRVEVCDDLELVERKSLRPFGLFTMVRFAKRGAAARPVAAE
ncbi:MAG: class I SAM-dependent methyltransferase [Hyphomicrobium sp.]|jgi:phosphatidylethanolamine/phosphatidyl-N-methylethanolamine N-methyltransferase